MRRYLVLVLASLVWLAVPLKAAAEWGEQAPLQFKLTRAGASQTDESLRLSYNVNLGGVRATASASSSSGSSSANSSSGTSSGGSSSGSTLSEYSSSTSADYYGGSSAAQLQEPKNYNNAVIISENITITLNGDGNTVISNGQTLTLNGTTQTSDGTSQSGENSSSGNSLN